MCSQPPPPADRSEVQIFCCGQKSVAWFDYVLRLWKCGRCGAPVKVVT